MRKSPLTLLTRAYFLFGALLALTFLAAVGPYLAQQTVYIWMAFGVGIALIAYGRTNIRRRWLATASIVAGTLWLAALVFVIFGVTTL